uniref:hypothetical protein n=1 Tax=Burkholderia arboris TaxID=488730 RepID=UPI003BEEC6AD
MADPSRFGPAIRCFLSPFDAVLELLLLRRHQDQAVGAVRRSNFLSRDFFYSHPFRQRPLTIHVAWLAHERRLVSHPDGYLIRVTRDQPARWRVQPHAEDKMMIDAGTWTILDRLHERAGLFAWRETLHGVREWLATPASTEHVTRCAFAAADAIESISVPEDEATQLALYDPEAGCWHFVPREAIVHKSPAQRRV